jgi:hypothetical protein
VIPSIGVSNYDYYAFKFVEKLLEKSCSFSLIPGTGSGACGPLISLLLSRGEKFIVLLDDDKSGKTARNKYYAEWYLPKGIVVTLGDVDPTFAEKRLEGLISDDTKMMIAAKIGSKKAPSKKEIGLFFAEMCIAEPEKLLISKDTMKNIQRILELLEKHFEKEL